MLMRGDPHGCDALLIPPTGRPPVEEDEGEGEGEVADSRSAGRALVGAFRRTAFPEAARLAVLCAPFTAVSLPLLQLICRSWSPRRPRGTSPRSS